MKEVQLSELFLFGIRKMKQGRTEEELLGLIQHTTPDGMLIDEPVMSMEIAQQLFRTDISPAETELFDNWKQLRNEYVNSCKEA